MCYFEKRKVGTTYANSRGRTNGWTLPLNSLQITTWIVLLYCGFVFFGIVAIAVEPRLLPASYVCIGFFFVIHVICLIAATTINPADDNSITRLEQINKPLPMFNRSLHQHVIEDGYCHICEVQVGGLSKHCSVCNKCVMVFDHHCKWLNNCVGQKNYTVFLLTLLSAILASIGMITLSIFVFVNSVQYFTREDLWWRTPISLKVAFEVLIGIEVFILLVSVVLLSQLLLFHIMIMYRGVTTYEYIKRSSGKKDEAKKRKEYPRQGSVQDPGAEIANGKRKTSARTQSTIVSVSGIETRQASAHSRSTLANEEVDSSPTKANDIERNGGDNHVTSLLNGSAHLYSNQAFNDDVEIEHEEKRENNNNIFSASKEAPTLPNSVPESVPQVGTTEAHNRESASRRRRRKKRSTSGSIDDLSPRRLPVLPGNDPPSDYSMILPPLRRSLEQLSNPDVLEVGEMSVRRLPPLTGKTSTTFSNA